MTSYTKKTKQIVLYTKLTCWVEHLSCKCIRILKMYRILSPNVSFESWILPPSEEYVTFKMRCMGGMHSCEPYICSAQIVLISRSHLYTLYYFSPTWSVQKIWHLFLMCDILYTNIYFSINAQGHSHSLTVLQKSKHDEKILWIDSQSDLKYQLPLQVVWSL